MIKLDPRSSAGT